jgi:hypothetical protein
MAEISFPDIDVPQGFNFQKDSQLKMGFIESLKIGKGTGDTATPADMQVEYPDGTGKKKVFAVLNTFSWQGGHGDPIKFTGNVSAKNKAVIELLRHQKLSDTSLQIKFVIFDFDTDPNQVKYFVACCAAPTGDNPVLDGLIQKDGNNLNIKCDMKEDSSVVSPKNFKFEIGIMPAPKEQIIHFATAIDHKVGKAWGITIGSA